MPQAGLAGRKMITSSLSILPFAILTYPGSISTPMAFRPQWAEASRVVPVPVKGSRTLSPVKEDILTRRCASSSGNGPGWLLVGSPLGPSHTCRKPPLVLLLRKPGRFPLLATGLAVPARLPQHEDKLNVIFDDGIGLVRLSQETGPVLDLVACVRYLVPQNRSEVVEADPPGPHDDVCVQRDDRMPAIFAARQANVTDHAHEAAARDKHAKAMPRYLVKLVMEGVIVLD